MLLRKYLTGGKIIKISNYDLERTIEIKFECYNELNDLVVRKLFIEIMSRQSNIILTNENNIIIDTLKHFDNKRQLLPAHEYSFVPIKKTSFLELSDFQDYLSKINNSQETTLTKKLTSTFIGFSNPIIKEMISSLNINNEEYSIEDLEKTYNYLNNLISSLGTNKIVCKRIGTKDYTLIFNNRSSENDRPISINKFIDDFYFDKQQYSIFLNSRNSLLKIVSNSLKKVYKKLENINEKLKECDDKDKFRLYGELLTANLYKINANENKSEIYLENYYDKLLLLFMFYNKKIFVKY